MNFKRISREKKRFLLLLVNLITSVDFQLNFVFLSIFFATLIVFKYGAPHTEMIYAHQASIFRAHKARGEHIFPVFPPFWSKRSKQAVDV